MKKVVTNKYFIYTICFWGFIGLLIYYISSIGLCAIGTADAVSQIYPIMFYTRRLLVNFADALLHGEGIAFPMVDFTLGMGDDTIAALNWHGFGDPFYLLTLLSSEENLPYFYSVLFYLRVYLGGAAFIAFVSELNNKKSTFAYVIGALVYCFTGFTVQSNMHTIFTHAMIYIPLMMLGAEKSMHKKKKGLLCAATFCFALSGFYFLYIGSVSLAVYVIYRVIKEKCILSDAIAKITHLIAEYILGLGLAAIIFIPAVTGFLSSDRVGVESGYPLIISWKAIKNLLKNMFLPSYSTEQELAVCTIGMIVLICTLLAKGRKQEKINLVLLFLTVIIPFFSCLMSGLGECYERWELVIDLYIAFLTVDLWDELDHITILQKAGVILIYLLLGIVGKREDILQHERFGKIILAYGLILLTIVVVLPLLKRFQREKMGKYVLFFAVYITICINWRAAARDREIESVQGRQIVEELIGDVDQEDFYRIDNEVGFAEPRVGMNISLFQGYPGTMEYVSIMNNRYITVFEKWDISNTNHNVAGLDQRTVLETMCAVKYFVAKTQNDCIVPYGFEYVKSTEDGEWSLYENTCALPVVYAYDKIYRIEDYEIMTGLEKQQVMLQAAAVEAYEGALPELEAVENCLYEGDYTISDLDGAVLENGIIKAEAGGTMTLSTVLRADCENCLLYTGERRRFGSRVEIEDGYVKYSPTISPLVINLGTTKKDRTIKITISFAKATEFPVNTLHVMYHNLSGYEDYVDTLKIDTEGKFKVRTNNISGKVDLSEDKILCVSVPYGSGWHAKIDGKETNIYPVNDLFMGIEVLKGAHEVELYYITPGIKTGAAISIVSLMIIIAYMVIPLWNKKYPSDSAKNN